MIRLLSVVGHGTNILPHFLRHYSQYVDEILLIVYESDIYPNLKDDVLKITLEFSKAKIVVSVKEQSYYWDKVTELYNAVKLTHPNDWWVIADVDEFHLYPNDDLRTMLSYCNENGYDIVRGGFIDRIGYGGSFPEIVDDKPIFEQFPFMGFFRYPMSNACPNKVCVMKGYVTLTSGQHYALIDNQTTWKWQGWNHPLIAPIDQYSVQVHHFKWDKTSIDRIKSVADLNKSYSYSNEYRLMYDKIVENNLTIDITDKKFMFEYGDLPTFKSYKNWNNLIRKIISI